MLLLSPSLFGQHCYLSSTQEEKLLQMSYQEFDQAEKGWRQYAKIGCYQEMGDLIDHYLDKNKKSLLDWQVISVTWHAGQMYAFNNDYGLAKIRFRDSINPNEGENAPLLWNDYVYATMAFLDKDKEKLEYHREKMAKGPILNGKKPNLYVVDSLIHYFDQPYAIAYAAAQG